MRYRDLPKVIYVAGVSVTAKCGECGELSIMTWDDLITEHTGGCGGHGDGEYCYCEGDQLSVSYKCPGCKKIVHIVHEDCFTG